MTQGPHNMKLICVAVVLVAVLCGGQAVGQDFQNDPNEPTYDPYAPPPKEAFKPAVDTPPDKAETVQETTESAPEKTVEGGPLAKGTFLFSADTLMSLTFSKNELHEGGTRSGSTFLFRMVPRLGYVVYDNVEVAVGVGVLTRQLFRDGGETATEVDGVLEVTGRYHLQLDRRLSVFGELSLGGYQGSSEQSIEIADGKKVNAQTDTLGVTFGAGAGAGWAVDDHFSLRAGLGLLGLIGTETVASGGGSLDASTFHMGLVIAGAYRF